ncbi:MAG TPA: hypothetical protein PLU90_03180 [Planctomycetota bacterium]|nr:hypothetical protein [Planctomycetota bacterium]
MGPERIGIVLGCALLVCAAQAFCAEIAQWEFNGNLESAGGGAALQPEAYAPAVVPEVEFLVMEIDGEEAEVAYFSRGTAFLMTHNLAPNGGGQYLNVYTLIMDVMFPLGRQGYTALWQTNERNTNDADWFIDGGNGLGLSKVYGGYVANGEWHRLALVVDSNAGTYTSFINGEQVQQIIPPVTVDGRWSVASTAHLFADEDQENWEGYVNSVQLRAFLMTPAELAELGGPTAAGIPEPFADECVVTDPAEDCNGNGIKDICDIEKYGTSRDCNGNGIPDECEIDADPSLDCDKNGVLDACEVDAFDCNRNGVIDACEIASGLAKDCNWNGIPDGCELTIAQWDFDGDLTETNGGEELEPYATAPADAPDFEFIVEEIDGEPAMVARFGRGTAFRLTHELGGNGGGEGLNRYTLIMDVAFPDRSPSGGWAVLFQTDEANSDDGDWFISPEGGVGLSNNYGGMAGDGQWHRLALVVDVPKGTYTSYVDGVFAQENQIAGIDGRYGVKETALLFADESRENSAGLVNSVQLRPYPMAAAEIAALGWPTAAGLPAVDCNKNGVPDACDIAGGTSKDANGNGVPDECEGPVETTFKRGDANADGKLDIADAVRVLGYLFGGGATQLDCLEAADANDDAMVNIADAVKILGHLFAGTGPLPPPFADCGVDPTADGLGCERFKPCE